MNCSTATVRVVASRRTGHPTSPGNLAEWGALVGPTAPLWAAAGFTLDDAARLVTLPPWDPARPTDTTLRHTAAVRDELWAAPTALPPCGADRAAAERGPVPAVAVLLVAGVTPAGLTAHRHAR